MRKKNAFPGIPSVLATSSFALVLAACGSGGGGGTNDAVISKEDMADQLNTAAEVVANCSSTSGTQKAGVAGAAGMLKELVTVSRSLAKRSTEGQRGTAQFKVQSKLDGSCSGNSGSATVSSEHENGVTDYHMVFDRYCAQGPNGDTIYDGELDAAENGTPSDSGPVISDFEMSMQDLAVQPAGDAGDMVMLTVQGARTSYGNPSTWSPDAPTADSPDQTTVSRIRVNNVSRGEVHELQSIDMRRVGGSSATIEILGGRYTNPDGDTAAIQTPVGEPLQVQIDSGDITGGVIELAGADDTVARITPVAGTRQIEVTVNGEPVGTSLNCDNADSTIEETVSVLLDSLPIY